MSQIFIRRQVKMKNGRIAKGKCYPVMLEGKSGLALFFLTMQLYIFEDVFNLIFQCYILPILRSTVFPLNLVPYSGWDQNPILYTVPGRFENQFDSKYSNLKIMQFDQIHCSSIFQLDLELN